jgi:outer membrane receptor for ferrienterochelin and colicins
MKKITVFIALIFCIIINAQSQNPVKAKFKVFGNCPQCKERIENALDVKGIKMAEWNVDSKIIEVVYQPNKISIEKIHELIAKSGHDTEKAKAPDKVYLSLPDCCMYRDNDNTHHD